MKATKSASCWMTERRLSKPHSMGDDVLRESTKREPMGFLSELKRRHVVQVGIAYLVVAWGAAQVAELVLDTFDTPGWVMRSILVALGLGFPVALVLAWIYDLRADGLHKESESVEAAGQPTAASAAALEESVEHDSIAVLPFVNMSSDPEQEYFSDGIAEELLNLLTRIPELRVAARTSAFSFKGKNVDIREIARQLHVAHVLEGSVRKGGNRIRITAQLIAAETGYHLWSETWDRTIDDIFAVQDEIAAVVAEQLKLTLLQARPRAVETNPEAYALYLQARHLARLKSAAGYEQALTLLEQVLAIAPDYAPAWAEQAGIYNMQAAYGITPCDAGSARAREAANRALSVDPDCAKAHAELGWTAIANDRDFASAANYYLTALAIDPGDLDILVQAAKIATNLRRFDTALGLFEYLVERDPVNPGTRFHLGHLHYCAGRIDAAINEWTTALRLSPGQIGTQAVLACAMLTRGDTAAALEACSREPDELYRLMAQVVIYWDMGQRAESDAALLQMTQCHAEEAAYNIAGVLAYRGENDRAFEWLEKALACNDSGFPELLIQPEFAGLRSDRRWSPFLARIGMAHGDLEAVAFDVRSPG